MGEGLEDVVLARYETAQHPPTSTTKLLHCISVYVSRGTFVIMVCYTPFCVNTIDPSIELNSNWSETVQVAFLP